MKAKKLVWCPRRKDVAIGDDEYPVIKKERCEFYKAGLCRYVGLIATEPCIGVEGTFTPNEKGR